MTQPLNESLRAARRARRRSYAWRLSVLVLLVIALWVISLMVGETFYSLPEVFRVATGGTVPGASFTVGELRLPRSTVAVAAGAAFGVAGVTFQTLLRNQLASPDVIGISSSASAAGVSAIVLFHASQAAVSAAALSAAFVVTAVIYALSVKSGFVGTRLILIGIGVAAVLQAWTNFVLSRAASWDLPTATRWITGSLNSMTWERGLPLLIASAILVPAMTLFGHRINLLLLGEDLAVGLGLRAGVVRVAALCGAVALIAMATSATGPIAFVAFMSGPIAARLFKPGPSLIAPAAAVGALLVLAADLAGQFLFGTKYPVGVITGALGAPFLIYLLTRTNR